MKNPVFDTGIVFYFGNIACDISEITRKSTAENRIGAADFLTWENMLADAGTIRSLLPADSGAIIAHIPPDKKS